MTRVKVCCIAGHEEARMAVRHGAAALGLVSKMPSGPGVISEDKIREIAFRTPPGVSSFLLTSRTDADAITRQHRRCATHVIQLVDSVPVEDLRRLRRDLHGISLVQVIHVRDARSVDEALEAAPWVDALLLDSGNPDLPVKELGGTGRTHDWDLSREIRRRSPQPVFLAGGLDAGNVAEAIRHVRPFGVDLCSGVRTSGALDEDKLRSFFEAVRSTG